MVAMAIGTEGSLSYGELRGLPLTELVIVCDEAQGFLNKVKAKK